MRFSNLKICYQDYVDKLLERIENKQRISLSSHAYCTLMHDLDAFQLARQNQGEVSSELINHIFTNFRDESASSLAEALQKKRSRMSELLSQMDPLVREETITLLLKEYEKDLEDQRKRRCREKDYPLSFRISKENLDYLASDEGQMEGAYHQDNIGTYIKTVLEEYCELPYVERERIYYKSAKDEIELAIKNKNLLKVVTRARNISYMKVLELTQDPERMYHYLVGLIASTKEGPWKIGSIRLSSISKCQRQAHSAFISAERENEIRSEIKKNGIQYLSGSDTFQKIVVEFTLEGEKMYRQILHLRPQYVHREGLVYEFECSLKQADDYFFKFGHNAQVLEPVSLAEKFQRKYHNAERKYNLQ